MSAPQTLETRRLGTLAELERFCEAVRETLADEPHGLSDNGLGESVHVAPAIRLSLVKDTLTDGSAVYDVRLEKTGREGV